MVYEEGGRVDCEGFKGETVVDELEEIGIILL